MITRELIPLSLFTEFFQTSRLWPKNRNNESHMDFLMLLHLNKEFLKTKVINEIRADEVIAKDS